MTENDEIYFGDVMKRTLRCMFGGAVSFVNKIEDVVDLFSTLVNPTEFEAVYKCGEGKDWYLQFKTEEPVLRLGDAGVVKVRDGINVTISRIDRRRIDFRIHWWPMFMNISVIEQFMNSIGKQCRMNRVTKSVKDNITIKSGIIQGTMIVSESEYSQIPYRERIYGREVLITVNGRAPKCLKCNEVGHNRSSCPKRARENGDTQKQSYAGAVRKESDLAGDSESEASHQQQYGPYGPGFSEENRNEGWSTVVSRKKKNGRQTTSDGGDGTQGSSDTEVSRVEMEVSEGVITQCLKDAEKSKHDDGLRPQNKRPYDSDEISETAKKTRDNDSDDLKHSQEGMCSIDNEDQVQKPNISLDTGHGLPDLKGDNCENVDSDRSVTGQEMDHT